MKSSRSKSTAIYILAALLLSGCMGINPIEWSVQAKIDPDLSGVFILETQFTQADIQSYAERNQLSTPESVLDNMSGDLADQLGWDFPYEVGMRPDENNSNYIWMQMQVKFDDPETFCGIFPGADADLEARAASAVGAENIFDCELVKTATPFTDVYVYRDTIFPNSTKGNFVVALPGAIIETTGAPYNQVGATWPWDESDVAVPLVLISAGLSDFKVDILVDFKGNAADLTLEVAAPQEVILYAKSMYPDNQYPVNALADRIAGGLNLPAYSVDVRELGSDAVILISMSGLSDAELQSALNNSGLMSGVVVTSGKSIFNSKYEFAGMLSPWKNGYGYPDSITLKVGGSGQGEAQSWVAGDSAQPVRASGSSTNWLVIGGLGVLCLLVVGGGAALLGGGFFLMRRKKA